MASKRAGEYWKGGSWHSQGYRSEPGIPVTARGRSGEALLRSDTVEIQIATTGEEPEVYAPTPSTFTSHGGHPRTLSAEYYAGQALMRITFPASSPASGGSYFYHDVSPDAWEAFKARNLRVAL